MVMDGVHFTAVAEAIMNALQGLLDAQQGTQPRSVL
jgi:hypothetical protein